MKVKCASSYSQIKDLKSGTLFAFPRNDSNGFLFGLKIAGGLQQVTDGRRPNAIDPKDGQPLFLRPDREVIAFSNAQYILE